jgi:hypothetical protein
VVSAKRAYLLTNKDSNQAADLLLTGFEGVDSNAAAASTVHTDFEVLACGDDTKDTTFRGVVAGSGTAGGTATRDASDIRFLRFHPEFLKLKRHFQTASGAFPAVLHETGILEPELLKMLNDSPSQFLVMMNETLEDGDKRLEDPPLGSPQEDPNGETDERDVESVDNEELTASDEQHLDNLCSLGNFDREIATDVYLMSGKDAKKAANFLLAQDGASQM